MLNEKNEKEMVQALEQRINRMQDMGDAELGTFTGIDWVILIIISVVIPVIAMVAAR
ncbi:MAG: hypothetical protein ACI9H8_000866 [Lysobacterales bacterium]|jgi:hypothetical protein